MSEFSKYAITFLCVLTYFVLFGVLVVLVPRLVIGLIILGGLGFITYLLKEIFFDLK